MRSVDITKIDGSLDINVGVHRSFGFEVPHPSKPVHEAGLYSNSSPDGPKRNRVLEQLVVIVRGCDITLQEYVGMAVDQAGHYRCARQVDGRNRARAGLDLRDWAHLFNSLSLDQNALVCKDAAIPDINQASGFYNGGSSALVLERRARDPRGNDAGCNHA